MLALSAIIALRKKNNRLTRQVHPNQIDYFINIVTIPRFFNSNSEKSIAPKYVGAARTSMAIATKWDYGQKIIIKSHDCSYPFVFLKLSRLTFNLREVI